MPTAEEKALDRVRKLLALATSPDLHEAASAAARAQALITEHRLQAWLDAERDAVSGNDAITDARDEPLETARKLRPWRVLLAVALAEHNGCVAYSLETKVGVALVLVGRAGDRAAVRELWSWLARRIEWLSATHGAGKSKRWHDDFRVGAVDAIDAHLRAAPASNASNAATRGPEATSALAVIDRASVAHRAALERFVEVNLRLGPGRTMRVNPRAYERGRNAAAEQTWLPAKPARD